MHYDSPHNTKKRTVEVDLLEHRKREQCAAFVRLEPAAVLMGYDPLGIHVRARYACAPAYDWRAQR